MALAEKIREGAKKHLAKHKESKKSTADKEVNKSGNVSHFEVHPIKGGHLLEKHFKRGTSYDMPGKEPERSAHKSMGAVAAAMKNDCPCGSCGGGEEE